MGLDYALWEIYCAECSLASSAATTQPRGAQEAPYILERLTEPDTEGPSCSLPFAMSSRKGPNTSCPDGQTRKGPRHAHPKLCTGLTIVSQGPRVSETCPNHIAGLHTLYGRFRHAYKVVSRSPSHDSNTDSLLPAKLGMLLVKGTCG